MVGEGCKEKPVAHVLLGSDERHRRAVGGRSEVSCSAAERIYGNTDKSVNLSKIQNNPVYRAKLVTAALLVARSGRNQTDEA